MVWPFSKKTVETKASISEAQILHPEGHDYAMQDWKAYAKEGFGQNPTIYRCIDLIATNAASVRPYVKVGGDYVDNHPLLDLLKRPNPVTGGQEFRTEAYAWAMLTGNIFTEKKVFPDRVSEMHNWQPFMMSIDRSKTNVQIPLRYWAAKNQPGARSWDVDPNSGESEMMHLALFNPSPNAGFMGQSPLAAAASSGDQLNAANKWRYNMFKNDCRPSGILSTEQAVTSGQRKELNKDMEDNSGWKKAGRFLVLGGGLKYQQLSSTPKDVDWLQGSKFNKQEIAEVFGVPTQLLGIEGSQTFANFEEARYAFYLMTVLPLVDLYFDELNRWLAPFYGENVEICYNKSSIDALDYMRRQTVEMKLNSKVLSVNEKREVLGLPPRDEEEADQIFIDPNLLPLGFGFDFTPEEVEAQKAARAYMAQGMEKETAERKAYEEFLRGDCHHG